MNPMRARWLSLMSILLVIVTLAACDGAARGGAPTPVAPTAGAPPTGATAGAQTVHVVSKNFSFSLATTRASAGTITFVVRNDGPAPHDFAIQGDGVNRKTPILMQGDTASLTVELKPGTYTYVCTVPGHDHLGMTGTFTVV